MKNYLSYQDLKKESFSYLEDVQRNIAEKTWTDFNTHDPGITIVDVLNYALSDLAYRSGFDIKDILESYPFEESTTPAVGQQQPQLFNSHFPTIEEVLTTTSVTSMDYRKYMLDKTYKYRNISEDFLARNIWFEKAEESISSYIIEFKILEKWVELGHGSYSIKYTVPKLVKVKSLSLNGLYDIIVDLNNFLPLVVPLASINIEPDQISSNRIRYMLEGSPGNYYAIEIFHPYWDEAIQIVGENFPLPLHIWGKVIDDVTLVGDSIDPVIGILNYFSARLEIKFVASHTIVIPLKINIIGLCRGNHRHLTDSYDGSLSPDPNLIPNLKNILKSVAADGFAGKIQYKMVTVRTGLKALSKEYSASRNLCEDLSSFRAARVEDISINGVFQVEDGANINEIMAEMFFQLDLHISPPVKFYNFEEQKSLVEERQKKHGDNKSVEFADVFKGPSLKHGFIDDDELNKSDVITAIYTSDLVNIIMDIPGIAWVDDFSISSFIDAVPKKVEEINVLKLIDPEIYKPKLILEKSTLKIRKGKQRFTGYSEINYGDIYDLIFDKKKEHAKRWKDSNLLNRHKFKGLPKYPTGAKLDLLDYKSIQNEFPVVYGIGDYGLSEKASDARKGQAKQLKGYLFIIEQVLANFLAQLAGVKGLFSYNETFPVQETTYHTKILSEIPGLSDFVDEALEVIQNRPEYNDGIADTVTTVAPLPDGTPIEDRYKVFLQGIVESKDIRSERKKIFIDHLMARFGENLNEFSVILNNFPQGTTDSDIFIYLRKLFYLRALPELAKNRPRAFNYCQKNEEDGSPDVWDTKDNISFFEKRMCHKLALEKCGRWGLSFCENSKGPGGKINKEKAKKTKKQAAKISAAKNSKFTKTVKMSLVKAEENYYSKNPKRKSANNDPDKKSDDTKKIVSGNENIYLDESIYLIEHILLRPKNWGNDQEYSYAPLIHFDEDRIEQVDINNLDSSINDWFIQDPYSFHVSIILPMESDKFKDPEFQNYAERTIRNDLPSHIIPHIYWLEKDVFCIFQELFRQWLHFLCIYPFLDEVDDNKIARSIITTNQIIILLDILNLDPLAEKFGFDLEQLIPLLF